MSADLLLDRLLQVPREQLAVSAVRDTVTGAWRHWTWGELLAAVRRAAGSPLIQGARGQALRWSSPRGGPQLIADLALQFGGVLGERVDADVPTVFPAGADDAGRLVRLRQDARPRDAAVVRGRPMDHAEVAAVAARVAERLGPGVVLSTAGGAVEQVLGWASVWGGASLVCAGPEVRAQVDPTVWVCRPADLRAVSAAAPDALQRLGLRERPRLTHVFVDGAVPPDAAARFPGATVGPWIA